jgi:hypothetical protein
LTGKSGWSGQSGVVGGAGSSGQSGWTGWTGWTGRSGWSGQSGVAGGAGSSGQSGWSGWSGLNGEAADSGYSGWSGQNGVGVGATYFDVADYVVYKDGSTYYAMNTITGIATSNATFSTLMNALTTALASTGGSILLKRGTYTETALITSTGYLTVRGEDRDTTIIECSGDHTMWLHGSGATDKLLTMSDLTIDGKRGTGGPVDNADTNIQGVIVTSSAYFNNMYFKNTRGCGIAAIIGVIDHEDPFDTFTVTNCKFYNNGSITYHHGPAIRTDKENNTCLGAINHVVITGNKILQANEHAIKIYTVTIGGVETPSVLNSYIAGNYIDGCYGTVIEVRGGTSDVTGNHFVNCSLVAGAMIYCGYGVDISIHDNFINGTLNSSPGISVDGGYPAHTMNVHDNLIYNCASSGISIINSGCPKVLIEHNRLINTTGAPIYIGDNNDFAQIKNNMIDGATDFGIKTESDYGDIAGNWITATYGMAEWGGDYNIIHDNYFYNISAANTMPHGIPAHSKYYQNIGWITNLTGTATIASAGNSIVVTHGMNGTPTKVTATGTTADTAALYVDTIGATYFTIHSVELVAGNRTVYWNAEV